MQNPKGSQGESPHNPLDTVLQVFSRVKHVHADTAERRTLSQIIDDIKRGRYAPQIARVRAATGDDRTELKKSLPYVSLSVTFKRGAKRSGKLEAIESFTGLMQIDLDHVQDVVSAIAQLKTLPYVLAAFRSPSGDGVKAIAWVKVANESEHLAAFATISRDVRQLTGEGMKQDAQTKDISRACFLSHDSELWINPAPVQLTEFVKLAEPPQALAPQIARATTMLAPADATEAERLIFDRFTRAGQISDGRRLTLYQIGLACHDAGLAVASALALGERLNAAICSPPKASCEVSEQISSAYQYARGPLGSKAAETESDIKRRHALTLKATRTIHAQYATPDDIRSSSAVTLVKSPQGTGKTECIKTLTAEAKSKGQLVAYIAHRKSLLRQSAEKLCLTFYKSMTGDKARSVAITPNSLPTKLKHLLAEYAGCVVFIDEVDQVLKDMTGKTCKQERADILYTFKEIIKNASKVYGFSADITPTVKALFDELGLSVDIVENTWRKQRKAKEFRRLSAIRAEIDRQIEAGRKVAIASDSKATAKVIMRSIEKKHAGKACLLITDENSQSKHIQELFADTAGFAAFDVVIYSPAMGSGLDINHAFGDVQFLCARGGSVTAPELLQMACRFRQWSELFFYCTHAKRQKALTENADEIFAEWQRKESEAAEYFFRDMHDGRVKPLDGYGWCLNLAARVQAEVNMSRNHLYGRFLEVLTDKGFTVETDESQDTEREEQIRAQDKESRAEIRAEYVTAVLDPANDISKSEREWLEVEATCTADRFKADRFDYIKTIGTDDAETMTQAVAVSLKQRRKQVEAFATFIDAPAEIAEREKAHRSDFLPDNKHNAMKARTRQAIESELRLLSGDMPSASPFGYSEADDDKLREIIDKYREQVTRYLFEVTDAMRENPILFFRSLYGQAGIKLTAKAHGKARTRYYTADAESVAFMRGIYDRRAAERLANEARRLAWLDPFAGIPRTVLSRAG